MMNHSLSTQGSAALHPQHPARGTVELEAGKAWSAEGRRNGVAIRCDSGTVWITVEGDPEDHVLEAPAVFETHGRGRIAAQALRNARITVQPS